MADNIVHLDTHKYFAKATNLLLTRPSVIGNTNLAIYITSKADRFELETDVIESLYSFLAGMASNSRWFTLEELESFEEHLDKSTILFDGSYSEMVYGLLLPDKRMCNCSIHVKPGEMFKQYIRVTGMNYTNLVQYLPSEDFHVTSFKQFVLRTVAFLNKNDNYDFYLFDKMNLSNPVLDIYQFLIHVKDSDTWIEFSIV